MRDAGGTRPQPAPATLLARNHRPPAALEKALEARKRERALTKFREAKGVADYGGPELAFAAEFQVRGGEGPGGG